MMYKEIIINTTTEGTDFVADAFFSVGCTGVKIIDKNDIYDVLNSTTFWDYVDPTLLETSGEIAKVSAFVSDDECKNKIDEVLEILNSYTGINLGSLEVSTADVDENEWYDNWKKYYKPIEAGNFVVVPKWLSYDNIDNKKIIYIDPGMAFGTGEHESTKMCLMLMSDVDFVSKRVIDVGTGSGILGIGAILSGAESCYMTDIDSCAVKASAENIELNKLDKSKIRVEMTDLINDSEGDAEVILANLTADILIRLSKYLVKFLKQGAILVCSGIIHIRKQEVIDAFTSIGLTLDNEVCMGEWNGLRFKN